MLWPRKSLQRLIVVSRAAPYFAVTTDISLIALKLKPLNGLLGFVLIINALFEIAGWICCLKLLARLPVAFRDTNAHLQTRSCTGGSAVKMFARQTNPATTGEVSQPF